MNKLEIKNSFSECLSILKKIDKFKKEYTSKLKNLKQSLIVYIRSHQIPMKNRKDAENFLRDILPSEFNWLQCNGRCMMFLSLRF